MHRLTLYRATYQAGRNGRCRYMTYAAQDQQDAERIAIDWQIDAARPLIVKALRPLVVAAEQFQLA